ncbi:MAG TPA: lysine exporter LysO family protein [Sphaerochaeta sp.]|nr:lysine exporter LysO family protein [Sphaerochaeta sp.]
METFIYLGKLALALLCGVATSRLLGKKRFVRTASLGQTSLVWLLLFFMGVNTGSIEGITAQFATIGLSALLLTIVSVLGTIVVAIAASLLFSSEDISLGVDIAARKEQSKLRRIWDVLKEPLFLISIVLLGLFLRLWTPLFGWFDSSLVSYLLYGMLFFVGMALVQKDISFKGILSDKAVLLLPLLTIVGSYLGALLTPVLTPYTIKEGLGMVSGFGWYSLSGILISDLGYPVLGSVSFLINLLRESFSFFLIPLLGRMGRRYFYPAVCTAGATSMDVTLVLLTSHFGSKVIIASIYHGVVMSLVAPLLMPLFF